MGADGISDWSFRSNVPMNLPAPCWEACHDHEDDPAPARRCHNRRRRPGVPPHASAARSTHTTLRLGLVLSLVAAVLAIVVEAVVHLPAILILIPVVVVGFAPRWHASGREHVASRADATPRPRPRPAWDDAAMKVRIGVGLGVRTKLHGPEFGEFVDTVERLRFDSLWLSERITGEAPDPVVAMSYAAGRTTRLKFGMSVLVLPGRNPVVLAKEMATLAIMSGGRLLPAFGLGVADGMEHQAFGVARGERARWFDEALTVMRKCWYDDVVEHDGERFHYEGLRVRPQPTRLDVWLGGIAPSELERVGRMADGWLPSFVTPADAAAGRTVIEQVAAEHDREIEDDHYGVLIPYTMDPSRTFRAQLASDGPDPRRSTISSPRRGTDDRHRRALRRRRYDEVRGAPDRRAEDVRPG